MIYDCFTFNNELDLLDLRLHELSSIIDVFVLVESTTTFSGQTKPLYYQLNKNRYKTFIDKIVHVVVEDMDNAIPVDKLGYFKPKSFQTPHLQAWSREIHQRNAIERGLHGCRAHDIILVSDVDEIPDSRALKNCKWKADITAFKQRSYNYFINCQSVGDWIGTKGVKYKHFDRLVAEQIRQSTEFDTVENGGWHFSFLGGMDSVINKIQSFSHQEHNKQAILDEDRLSLNLNNALDIFNRPFEYKFVKIDNTYPKYLRENLAVFAKYIRNDSADKNTLALRNALFSARASLYWKELELENVIKTMNYYRRYSFPHIFAKIHKILLKD